jgi:hypothetical protein
MIANFSEAPFQRPRFQTSLLRRFGYFAKRRSTSQVVAARG